MTLSETRMAAGTTLKLHGRLLSRADLSPPQIDAMFSLLSRNFHGVAREVFLNDLHEKNWVVIMEDQCGELRGFTTFLMTASMATSKPTTVVYSGDTIVDPMAWGTPVLPKTWVQSIYRLRPEYPAGEFVWLLLTSGFRTYRFMSVFCKSFYPRFDRSAPPEMERTMRQLAREKYGRLYDEESGIVHFPRPQALREHLLPIPEGRLADPHIDFFLKKNPGHRHGDELVSIASLSPENLSAAGRRMLA